MATVVLKAQFAQIDIAGNTDPLIAGSPIFQLRLQLYHLVKRNHFWTCSMSGVADLTCQQHHGWTCSSAPVVSISCCSCLQAGGAHALICTYDIVINHIVFAKKLASSPQNQLLQLVSLQFVAAFAGQHPWWVHFSVQMAVEALFQNPSNQFYSDLQFEP